MSLSVSSWFIEQSRGTRGEPLRRFTLGGSDRSADVLRWPSLRFRADTVELGTTALHLSNGTRGYDTLVHCPHLLTTSCELALGFAHPSSGPEYLSLFTGAPSHVAFEDGGTTLRMQVQGRTRRLSDVSLGIATESGGLDFTTSAHHPSDLAWILVTCHGRLSAVQSTSNPDIDWAEWAAWKDANAVRDVRVQAYLTGERIYQVLEALAVMDYRTIVVRNGRLGFRDAVEPYGFTPPAFPMAGVLDSTVVLDPARVTNHFFVEAAYDPAKAAFTAQFTKVHSQSELQYGRHSARFSSRGLWFAEGADARYLAEDRVRFGQALLPLLRVRAVLAGGLEYGVGDVVTWVDSAFGLTGRAFRIVEQALHLEDGRVDLTLESAQRRPWQFQGSVASANLLVRTLTALDAGSLLALRDDLYSSALMRMDSGGTFSPTGAWGTALGVLNATTVLLGGPASSGGPQAVLQRSADAGSSTVVVSSLAPNVSQVFDLFEVRSGTWLASTNSGGIWRSTDSGSSWALTQTISGAYHVQRFFRPYSGTLWGGTGDSAGFLAQGLHIWASQNEGVSWLPAQTVETSGTYRVNGWHALSGSEWLLSHRGVSLDGLGVRRGTFTGCGAVNWTTVLPQAAFGQVLRTDSGHLLFGFDEAYTVGGGSIYRSLDQGSAWYEDSHPVKRGNITLRANGDGTVDAFVARMSVGLRTDRYRNYLPDEVV